MQDGPFWKRGDVFLSMRTQSMVMLYRPTTDKVLWYRIGPWMGQHDVQILDDHRIAIFDNRSTLDENNGFNETNSRELVYDFSTGSITSPWETGFRRLGIATAASGRGTPLANGDLVVEETNSGRIVRMDAQGKQRWRFVSGNGKGDYYRLSWSRYLDPVQYSAAIQATLKGQCK